MDEIEKLLRANQGSTLTKQMVDKLVELIYEYGNEQYEDGFEHQKVIMERVLARSM